MPTGFLRSQHGVSEPTRPGREPAPCTWLDLWPAVIGDVIGAAHRLGRCAPSTRLLGGEGRFASPPLARGGGSARRGQRGSESAASRGPDAAGPREGTRHPGFCGAADACARAAAVCGTVMRSRVKGSLGCMVCERAGPCQVRGGGATYATSSTLSITGQRGCRCTNTRVSLSHPLLHSLCCESTGRRRRLCRIWEAVGG